MGVGTSGDEFVSGSFSFNVDCRLKEFATGAAFWSGVPCGGYIGFDRRVVADQGAIRW